MCFGISDAALTDHVAANFHWTGANTAVFSLIDALLLRSLPVHDPGSLVELIAHENGETIDMSEVCEATAAIPESERPRGAFRSQHQGVLPEPHDLLR